MMDDLIGSALRTIAGLFQVQWLTTKTESEGTNKILRYLLVVIVVILAIVALVAGVANK